MPASSRSPRNNGPKTQPVKYVRAVTGEPVEVLTPGEVNRLVEPAKGVRLAKRERVVRPEEMKTKAKVTKVLGRLFAETGVNDAAGALVPWVCDALDSPNSR